MLSNSEKNDFIKDFIIFFLLEKHSSIAFARIIILKFLIHQRLLQTTLIEIQLMF